MLFRKIIFAILIFSICTKLLGGIILYHDFSVTNSIKETVSKTPTSGILISFELMGVKIESDPETDLAYHFLPTLYFFNKLTSSLKGVQTDKGYSDFFAFQKSPNCKGRKLAVYQAFRI